MIFVIFGASTIRRRKKAARRRVTRAYNEDRQSRKNCVKLAISYREKCESRNNSENSIYFFCSLVWSRCRICLSIKVKQRRRSLFFFFPIPLRKQTRQKLCARACKERVDKHFYRSNNHVEKDENYTV